MNQSVEWLNELSPQAAEKELLKCCGSTRWARLMAQGRPFGSVDSILQKADELGSLLSKDDWLEAFRAHPKIGETKAVEAQSKEAAAWSAQEQSRLQNAAAATKTALAEGNFEYEERFGFIFVVCATGRSSEEMLAILESRLRNARETELRIAAEEQRKITKLRLEKLLSP